MTNVFVLGFLFFQFGFGVKFAPARPFAVADCVPRSIFVAVVTFAARTNNFLNFLLLNNRGTIFTSFNHLRSLFFVQVLF